MRFEASVSSTKVIVLVDTSSTHNFRDPKLVSKLSLPIEHLEQLRVIVADGRSMLTKRTCRDVQLESQGFKIWTYFLLLPVKCCDLVLGI